MTRTLTGALITLSLLALAIVAWAYTKPEVLERGPELPEGGAMQ